MSFFNELKRRNVIRVAGLYLAGAWLLIQVAGTVLQMVDAPVWLSRGIVLALAIGFIPALIFAWAFELTPAGLKREGEVDRTESITPHTGRKLDRIIMVVLALALAALAFDKMVLAPQRERSATESARNQGRSEARVESFGDKSIAVLPFVNMSADEEQEYFSDGISEELLNLLAKIPELRVISRSSAFSYKGKDVKLAQVAKELNVAHVLEGSVRKSGNQVRITAQLIDARSDTHLWSETYDRPLDDIFAVQDEIAAVVVTQLKVKLLGTPPKAPAPAAEAYALYLQARYLQQQFTPETLAQAIVLYKKALAVEPSYAAAWVGLANVYSSQTSKGLRPVATGYLLVRDAIDQALVIDPNLAEADRVLGRIERDTGNLAAAAAHVQRALELDPGNPLIVLQAAGLSMELGRMQQAIKLYEFVVARDPLIPNAHFNLSLAYYSLGRPDDAIASITSAIALSPELVSAHYLLGASLLLQGEKDAALKAFQEESSEPWRLIGLVMAYHAMGRSVESTLALEQLIKKYGHDWPYNIAYTLAFRNEADRAFDWLNQAVQRKDTGVYEASINPLFVNIRSDPRWLPFMRKIGSAPEQLAAIKFDVKVPK